MALFTKDKLKKIQAKKEVEKRHTILIVDDEGANARLLEGILEKDYHILTAGNGKEALELVKQDEHPERIHLIVSDQRMPQLTGVEFLTQTIPIIPKTIRVILTGFTDIEAIIKAINDGQIYKFVTKPIEPKEFVVIVKRALEAYDLEIQKIKLVDDLKEAYSALEESKENLHSVLVKQAENEKMAALGGLVAGLTHEVNTPLGIGITAASHLTKAVKDFDEIFAAGKMKKSDLVRFKDLVKESSGLVFSNLNRASELILSFKHVAVDQSSNEGRSFNIKEYINEVIFSLRPRLKRTKHDIIIDCPDSLIISSFPGVFSQILTNFIMNSLIHGFENIEKGEISIHISTDENHLKFIYQDNGKGMNREDLDRLFEPFFTTKRGKGGSGIGTHIVYSLVTKTLHGDIQCESSPGEGIKYDITIPLETPKEEDNKSVH